MQKNSTLKRALSLFLCLAMVCGLLAVSAVAVTDSPRKADAAAEALPSTVTIEGYVQDIEVDAEGNAIPKVDAEGKPVYTQNLAYTKEQFEALTDGITVHYVVKGVPSDYKALDMLFAMPNTVDGFNPIAGGVFTGVEDSKPVSYLNLFALDPTLPPVYVLRFGSGGVLNFNWYKESENIYTEFDIKYNFATDAASVITGDITELKFDWTYTGTGEQTTIGYEWVEDPIFGDYEEATAIMNEAGHIFKPATITISTAYNVKYDIPADAEVVTGTKPTDTTCVGTTDFNVSDVTMKRSIEIEGKPVNHCLKEWTVTDAAGDEVTAISPAAKGGTFKMPSYDITLTPVWAKDANGDDVDDDLQGTVTYQLRNAGIYDDTKGATLSWPAAGKFFDTDATKGSFKATPQDGKIALTADTIPDVALLNPPTAPFNPNHTWKIEGFYLLDEQGAVKENLGDAKAALVNKELAVAAKETAVIEIRLKLDDGQGGDGREKIDFTVKDGDTTIGETLKVDPAATYAVYPNVDANGNGTGTPVTGACADNNGVLDVSPMKPDKQPGTRYPFIGWNDPVYDENTKIVTVTPKFDTKVDEIEINVPGPVIDNTDPENPGTDPQGDPENPVKITIENDSVVIVRGFEKADGTRDTVVTIPVKDNVDAVAEQLPNWKDPLKKDVKGNPFEAWVFGEKNEPDQSVAGDKPFYYVDAQPAKEVKVAIVEPADPNDPTSQDKVIQDAETKVPKGTQYQILDGNGSPSGDPITVNGDQTINVPRQGTDPNNAGEFFTGAWKVEPAPGNLGDTDGDGVTDVYYVQPVYGDPNDEDITITPVDGANVSAAGEGYTILAHPFRTNNKTDRISFVVKVNGAPISEQTFNKLVAANKLVVTEAYSYGFQRHESARSMSNPKHTEVSALNYDTNGVVFVNCLMNKSAVLSITLSYKDNNGNTLKGGVHNVIRVGDVSKDYAITVRDLSLMSTYLTNADLRPKPANQDANSMYLHELLDVNKDKSFAVRDLSLLSSYLTGAIKD